MVCLFESIGDNMRLLIITTQGVDCLEVNPNTSYFWINPKSWLRSDKIVHYKDTIKTAERCFFFCKDNLEARYVLCKIFDAIKSDEEYVIINSTQI